jgi:hypothetical protein
MMQNINGRCEKTIICLAIEHLLPFILTFFSLQIEHMNSLNGLLPLLQQFQEGKLSVKKPQFVNKLYSIEWLRLY